MHERLSARDVTRIYAAREPSFIDPLNLVGERNGVAFVIVDACDTQYDRRDRAAPCLDHLLGLSLRARVIPTRVNRRMYRNQLTWPTRRMYEHRAAENELLDVKLHLMERS